MYIPSFFSHLGNSLRLSKEAPCCGGPAPGTGTRRHWPGWRRWPGPGPSSWRKLSWLPFHNISDHVIFTRHWELIVNAERYLLRTMHDEVFELWNLFCVTCKVVIFINGIISSFWSNRDFPGHPLHDFAALADDYQLLVDALPDGDVDSLLFHHAG